MFRIFENIRRKFLDWILEKEVISVGELHQRYSPSPTEIYNGENLKFIEQAEGLDIFVDTPSGFSTIKKSLKTVKYNVYTLTLEDGFSLDCADTHIVMYNGAQKFVRDLVPGKDLVDTIEGTKKVVSVYKHERKEQMYDLELDDQDHIYYTNGILSHNTTTIAAYLLWYTCFAFDKTVLVASNKNSNAMEIMGRVIYAYEELPHWLKPGAKYATKHSMEFDNGSKIYSQATTENTGRGLSISLLMLDELAFVPRRIQEEMWISVQPTLSTGGGCIISSTPNGDSDLFAQLWTGAKLDTNSFNPIEVQWDEHPDRDEDFKQEQIGQIGELRWRQEFECQFLSSDPLLISSLALQKLQPEKPLYEELGFAFWETFKKGKTYVVGIDVATGVGSDYSTIEIFDLDTMTQVGEFRRNDVTTSKLYAAMKWLFKKMLAEAAQDPSRDHLPEVYFSFENNGVGQGIASLYENDTSFPEVTMISEPNKYGLVTTGKNKIVSCMEFKNLIERIKGGFNVRSELLTEELKNYVSNGKSYEAKPGATDDLVAAMLIIVQILKRISSFDEMAFNAVYEFDNIEEDEEFGEDPIPMIF